jgi:c(7)-type cytochrome triheme protein
MLRGLVIALITSALVAQFLTSCSPGQRSATRSAGYVVESGVSEGKRWRDNRVFATEVKTESLTTDGIHDPSNDALRALQEPAEALSAFPLDRRGGVDWVKALKLGIIEPRAELLGEGRMEVLDTDILFNDTDQMPWVKFPHSAHTQWLACNNCHPAIFIAKKGANNPSMDGILAGEHCGRCHGKVAFAMWTCERCHNTPHAGTPKRWIDFMGVRPESEPQPTVAPEEKE